MPPVAARLSLPPGGDASGRILTIAGCLARATTSIASQSARDLAQTHVDWGHFGEIVADWVEKHALESDFVACHGQTIFHQPEHG